ncbi:pyrimidine-nucleoside phosphorylase [Staphylococcus schleiferi]|nr:pyrimidine-nucleoside phosphorylase [Staphylococcus schleiferi]SUM87712.1 pyrimidine-nucleoside phosphorylase [Staphylococcus schleiferi]
MLKEVIENGKALEKFKTFLSNQGGDATIVDDPSQLPTAQYQFELPAKQSGVVAEMIANEIGIASMMLGAGRQTKEDEIDLAVGLVLNKKIGDRVEEGESLLTIHANTQDVEAVKEKLYDNITILEQASQPKLIHTIITE